MKKRILTKIGDIFGVEVDNDWKCYFQYVCNDMTQLNSSVIRFFGRRYHINEQPSVDEIVAGEVDFYAHTILAPGIQEGAWYKYGKHKDVDNIGLQQVLFGTVCATKMNSNMDIVDVNPLDNWRIGILINPLKISESFLKRLGIKLK